MAIRKKYLIITFICASLLSSCIFRTDYDTYVNEKIKPLTINGIVVSKYKEETGCFGAIVIEQSNSIDTLHNIFSCTVDEEKVWDHILPKDSIYKKSDSLNVEIVRDGKRAKFTFPISTPL